MAHSNLLQSYPHRLGLQRVSRYFPRRGIHDLRCGQGLRSDQGRTSGEKQAPRPRKGLAPHLERVEVVIEPENLPEHAGRKKVLIGEDISERLDVIPARFRVIVTRRPKYAFKDADGVVQALAPAHIIG